MKVLHLIMIAFNDVGLNEVPPASVELLKHHENLQDYVRLPLDRKLEEDTTLKMESSYTGGTPKVQCTLSELHVCVDCCQIYVIEKTNKQANKQRS